MRKIVFVMLIAISFVLGFPGRALCSVLMFDLNPFAGDPTYAKATVDDNTLGFFRVNVKVSPFGLASVIGDITGVFFNFSPLLLASDITNVTSGPIIGFGTNTNDLGGGVNLNPHADFDVGIRYNGFTRPNPTPPPGNLPDDIQEVEFTINRLANANLSGLTINDFAEFGLRLQSVGPYDGDRSGSSKLSGTPNVPEPATALLFGFCLSGLFISRKFIK